MTRRKQEKNDVTRQLFTIKNLILKVLKLKKKGSEKIERNFNLTGLVSFTSLKEREMESNNN